MHDLTFLLAMGSPGQGGGATGFLTSMLPIVAMIAILWFLLIRPQQKEQQKHREMVKNLKKGDEVVTVGGIYGRIMSLDAEKVTIKIAENVKVDVERSKIVRVVAPHVGDVESK
ncbi:preprotein translocase subunit YajC [soil metagenome]